LCVQNISDNKDFHVSKYTKEIFKNTLEDYTKEIPKEKLNKKSKCTCSLWICLNPPKNN